MSGCCNKKKRELEFSITVQIPEHIHDICIPVIEDELENYVHIKLKKKLEKVILNLNKSK
jgi:hypothetical protein